jgi:membrane-associated phospholipid phosphatase
MREDTLPAATPRHPETRRRFALLRDLIRSPRRRRRLVLGGVLLALLLVASLSVVARLYTVLPLDVWFTRELQEHQLDAISRVMYAVSIFGYQPWALVTVAAGTLLVAVLLGWREGLYLLLITVGQGLTNVAIKTAIGRPRPISELVSIFVPEHGYSFPSGHVMFYTVFFGFLLFLTLTRMPRSPLRWLAAVPLAMMVALVGPSRIILGAHWLSDVMAAYLLSLAILALAIEGYLRYLAPPTPAAQEGLVASLDASREQAAPH